MGRYSLRGVDPAGKRRTQRVHADTAREALDRLESAGWQQLEVLTDAIFAAESTPEVERSRPQVEAMFNPVEELGFRRFGAAWQVWMMVKKGGWLLLAVFLWLAWQRFNAPVFSGGELTAWLLLLVAIGVAAFSIWSPQRYKRLVLASSAGRWEETLRRVESLQRSKLGKLIGPSELSFRRATALLGLGREAEALAALEGVDLTGTPEWAFQVRLGDFHARRQRLDEARTCYRRAVELGSGHAEAHLSLAEFLTGYQIRDPLAARTALARARTLPIPANCDWAVERIEAMIAVEEGRFAEALEHLKRSSAAFRRLADNGLRGLILAHLGAYAALALAGLGRRDEARAALAASRAEQWLQPHAPDLLARSQAAAG